MSSNITNNQSPTKTRLDSPVDPYVAKRPRTGDAYASSLRQSTLDDDFDFTSIPFAAPLSSTDFGEFDALFGSSSLPLDYSASLAEDRPPSSSSLSSTSSLEDRLPSSSPPPVYSIADQELAMKRMLDTMKTFKAKDLSTIKHKILTVVDALSPQNKGKLYLSFGKALLKFYKKEVDPTIVPDFFECIGKVYTVAAQSGDLGLEGNAAQLQSDFINSYTARSFSSFSSSAALSEPFAAYASPSSSSVPVFSIAEQNGLMKLLIDRIESFKAEDLSNIKEEIQAVVDVLSPQNKARLYFSFGKALLKLYETEKVLAVIPELFVCVREASAFAKQSGDTLLATAILNLQSKFNSLTERQFSSSQPPSPLLKPVASTKKSDNAAKLSISVPGVEVPLEIYDVPYSALLPFIGELLQSKIDKIKKLQKLLFDSPLKKREINLVDELLQEPVNPYFSFPPAIKGLLRCKYAIALMNIYRQDRNSDFHKKMVENYVLAIQASCEAEDLATSALAFYNLGAILEMTKEPENLASAKDLYSSAIKLEFSNPALRADLELALARVDKTSSSK